jgi:hypothetical protein
MNLIAGCGSWLGCYCFWFCYLTSFHSVQAQRPELGRKVLIYSILAVNQDMEDADGCKWKEVC